MEDISTAGWVAIIILAVLLLSTNLSLIAIARRKKSSPPAFIKSLDLIRNPWEDEDQQWQKLNAAVKHLDESKTEGGQDQDH